MANKFSLTITTGNDAFGESGSEDERREIARILRETADRITFDNEDIGFFRNLKDTNGNIVGTFALKDENYK